MVQIFISFATEEFVTPAHSDVLIRLTSLLSDRGIVGSFHVTGELARGLRARGRRDVISALKQHELGYHSNTHGAHPFIGSVCEDRDWDTAVAELMRTESRGILDITDIFGRRPAYYVTEFTKAPQLVHALRGLGIDTLGFSGLPASGSPFSWYAGSLCYTGPHAGIESPPAHKRIQHLKAQFDRLCAQAEQGEADGIIKLFNHPYKFVYNNKIASWVSKNRIYKGYDIHSPWIVPEESIYDQHTVDRLFDDFAEILDYALAKPGVEFRSTTEVAAPFHSRHPVFVNSGIVVALANRVGEKPDYIDVAGASFSPAEIFALMTSFLSEYRRAGCLSERVPFRHPLGPVEEFEHRGASSEVELSLKAILNCATKVDKDIDFLQRLPACLRINDHGLPTAAAYRGFANAVDRIAAGNGEGQSPIVVMPADALPEIAGREGFSAKTWTKESYPDGFTGEAICRHARLQTWTYKPARRTAS